MAARPRLTLVGDPRARRLADHDARAAARAPRRSSRGSARELRRRRRARSSTLDLGGGLGISYDGSAGADPRGRTCAALVAEPRPTGLPIVLEPGRAIVGPAGALLARVVDVKPRTGGQRLRRPRRRHDRADAAGALRRVPPHRAGRAARAAPRRQYEIVGPICESSDVVGRDRVLPPLEVGDLVADPRRRRLRRRRWRRTTIAVRCRPRCWSTTGAGASIRRRQTLDDMLRARRR